MLDKKLYLQLHKDKTKAELRAILTHNAIAISSKSGDDAQNMLAESQACSELLQKMISAEEYLLQEGLQQEFAEVTWKNSLENRRNKAILNLPAATSYHGQLVAAVLDEEDGLTADEIRNWSDELLAMADHEYEKLLTDLCNEEILCCTKEGVYSILSLCMPDLMRTNVMLWLAKHYDYVTEENASFFHEGERAFLHHLLNTRKPATEIDWIEYAWKENRKKNVAANPRASYSYAKKELSKFVEDGVLSITPIADSDLNTYYFTMLGEKEEQ